MDQKTHIRRTGKVISRASFILYLIFILVLIALSLTGLKYGIVGHMNLFESKFPEFFVFLQIILTNPDMLHHGILPHHKVSSNV